MTKRSAGGVGWGKMLGRDGTGSGGPLEVERWSGGGRLGEYGVHDFWKEGRIRGFGSVELTQWPRNDW